MRKLEDLASLVEISSHFDSTGVISSELCNSLSLGEIKIMIDYLDPKNGYFTWGMRHWREVFIEESNRRLIEGREDKLNDLGING